VVGEPDHWGLVVNNMNDHKGYALSNLQLRQGFISAVILIGLLIGYGIIRYPLIVSEAGILSLLIPLLMLLVYGVVAAWVTHKPTQVRSDALKSGTIFGLLVGVTFIITISVENFAEISQQAITISTLGFMLINFLIFAYSGWYGTNKSSQFFLGIFTSVWSAMIGVLIALLFGFMVNFLFAHRLEQNLQASAEYLLSGSQDLRTFTFWNTLDSASSHLFEAPILAAGLGGLGSLIYFGYRQLHQKFSNRD
jgi:hypothetical protein